MSGESIAKIVGLIAEWIPELSAEEKERIYQEFEKRKDGLFSTKKDFAIASKFAVKGERITPLCPEVIDCHFFYMEMIKLFYKMRNEIPMRWKRRLSTVNDK